MDKNCLKDDKKKKVSKGFFYSLFDIWIKTVWKTMKKKKVFSDYSGNDSLTFSGYSTI